MIRLLTHDDATILRDLLLESRTTDPDAFIGSFENLTQISTSEFTQNLYSDTYPPISGHYGCFIDNQLIGHLQLSQDTRAKQRHLLNLYELYIHPKFRGQGHAHQLLNYTDTLTQVQPHLEYLYLSVISTNQPAISLYHHHHFHHYATKQNAIKTTTGYADELLFVKSISH